MVINNQNVETLIFQDKKLIERLHNCHSLYNQWLLGIKQPALRFLSKKAILRMLEVLNDSENITILENYFNDKVVLKPLDYHVTKNFKIPIDELEQKLNLLKNEGNISISRNADYCYLSIWK